MILWSGLLKLQLQFGSVLEYFGYIATNLVAVPYFTVALRRGTLGCPFWTKLGVAHRGILPLFRNC